MGKNSCYSSRTFVNFILAFICAVVIVGSIGYDPCRVDVLYEDSPAAAAGLSDGANAAKSAKDYIDI